MENFKSYNLKEFIYLKSDKKIYWGLCKNNLVLGFLSIEEDTENSKLNVNNNDSCILLTESLELAKNTAKLLKCNIIQLE